jgi:hypothetical protein
MAAQTIPTSAIVEVATDTQFSHCRVRDTLDLLGPLPEFIKHSDTSPDERVAIRGRHDVLDKQIQAARADLAKLEREYGAAAAANAEQRRPTMRGFKIAHGKLGKELRTARARVTRRTAPRPSHACRSP